MSNKIQHKLYNYEQTPRVSVWEKIASDLEVSSKLYGSEVIPPATAWNKIQAALNEPKQRRIAPFIRYAVAAALIGLLAWGGLQLINKNKSGNDVAHNKPVPENKIVPVPVIDNNNPPVVTPDTDEVRNDAALEESKKTFAKLDIPKKKKMNNVSGFHFSGFTNEAIPAAEKITDRYIVLMTPDGNFIRMSKKLSNLVCCVSGEEQDADCKDQVERWRKQLACSSASHPGNFLDILSLVNSLQD